MSPHPLSKSSAGVAAAASTMSATVLLGDRRATVAPVQMPEPGPGEVRVRIAGSGVCASTLPLWEGRAWFDYPRAPGEGGHEGWGTVDALGEGVLDLRPGTRVALWSQHAFAQYDVARREHLLEIPDAIGDRPAPAEPLGCAVNALRRSCVRSGEDVAIVGVGFLGALCVQLAVAAGARVFALSRHAYARDAARDFGASEVLSTEDRQAAVATVRERTGGRGCPCVIEVTGKQAPLDLATDLTSEGGRLVIAGYHQVGLRSVNRHVRNWPGLDVINAHERDPAVCIEGMRRALDEVAAGRLDPFPLYTHEFGLGDLSRALDTLDRPPDGFFKALVRTDTPSSATPSTATPSSATLQQATP